MSLDAFKEENLVKLTALDKKHQIMELIKVKISLASSLIPTNEPWYNALTGVKYISSVQLYKAKYDAFEAVSDFKQTTQILCHQRGPLDGHSTYLTIKKSWVRAS